MSLEYTLFYKGFFDEGNRADMKSGDTNKIIDIIQKKKHTYAKNIA